MVGGTDHRYETFLSEHNLAKCDCFYKRDFASNAEIGSAECKAVLGPVTDELAISAVSSGDIFTALGSIRADGGWFGFRCQAFQR